MSVEFMRLMEEGEILLRRGKDEGRAEGRTEGICYGELIKLISMVRKKEQKGMPAEEIADLLEEDTELIRQLYKAIKDNRSKTDIEIADLLNKVEV